MKYKSTRFAPVTSRACFATAALTAIFCQSTLVAAPLYWDGNSTTAGAGNTTGLLNKAWGTDAAWNSDTAGVTDTFTVATNAGDDLFFVAAPGTGSGAVAFNPTVTGTQSADSITFQSSGAQTLSGGTINLDAGGLVGSQFAYGSTNRGAVTISSSIALQAAQIWGNNASTGMTVSGLISGASNLTIQNSATSTLTLSGVNTGYSGTTTLTAGSLTGAGTAVDTLSAFGTGGIILDGGTLLLKSNGSGNGNKTIVAANNLTTGSAAVTVNVNNNGANGQNRISLNNLSVGTGQFNVTGGNLYSLRIAGTTTLTGNATFNVTSAGLQFIDVIGDAANGFGLTKLGAVSTQTVGGIVGTLSLSGVNTYTGVTSVFEGVLTLNGNAPSGSPGTLGTATSAVLLGNTSGSANAYLLANNFTIERDVVVQPGNTGIAGLGSNSNSGSGTYSGSVTLGASGISHHLTLLSGAFHVVNISGVIQDPAGLVGTAGVVTIGDVTVANGLTGSFSPNPTNGSSRIDLTNANTYTGGTVMDTSGGLRIGNADCMGTGNLSLVRGTITQTTAVTPLAGISGMTWDGNFTVNSFNFAPQGPVNLGTAPITLTGNRILTVVNNTSTIGGVISGAGRSLQLNGGNSATQGLALNGASTFDGGLTVAGATNFDLTAVSGNATAFGTGQLNLTNSARSKATLTVATTVGSLTSGINNSATFTGGASALTAGNYALTFTGGGGTGAAGTATVNSSGVVTAVAITSLGSNYTSAPGITLDSSSATITPAVFGSSLINCNAQTLTLSGTNGTPATYNGIISGSGGSLVKDGPGIQILSGANTYTGSTDIVGGTLTVTGSLGATDVWVDPNGTLSGTGSFGGNVTVNNGGHLALAVAGTPGSQIPLQITGALTLESDHILDLTATPTPANGVYILATAAEGVTYTAGDVNLTGVSGVVSVSGDNLSLILTVGAGGSNYASWATANGISGQPASGDFDKDGLSNFVEYALGKNPTVSSQPPGTLIGGILSFSKGSDAINNDDVIFEIEESTDLGIADPWATVAYEDTTDNSGTITYQLPAGQPKEFARLKVTQVP